MLPKLTDIFLVAGDRDFIDAIQYCRHVLKKQITIIGFKQNMSHRLINTLGKQIILFNDHWTALTEQTSSNFSNLPEAQIRNINLCEEIDMQNP